MAENGGDGRVLFLSSLSRLRSVKFRLNGEQNGGRERQNGGRKRGEQRTKREKKIKQNERKGKRKP
jgi:hypothetical protein